MREHDPWPVRRCVLPEDGVPVIRFRTATRQDRCGATSGIDTEGSHMNGVGSMCERVFALVLAGSLRNGED
jgi:hypothetical protein